MVNSSPVHASFPPLIECLFGQRRKYFRQKSLPPARYARPIDSTQPQKRPVRRPIVDIPENPVRKPIIFHPLPCVVSRLLPPDLNYRYPARFGKSFPFLSLSGKTNAPNPLFQLGKDRLPAGLGLDVFVAPKNSELRSSHKIIRSRSSRGRLTP